MNGVYFGKGASSLDSPVLHEMLQRGSAGKGDRYDGWCLRSRIPIFVERGEWPATMRLASHMVPLLSDNTEEDFTDLKVELLHDNGIGFDCAGSIPSLSVRPVNGQSVTSNAGGTVAGTSLGEEGEILIPLDSAPCVARRLYFQHSC